MYDDKLSAPPALPPAVQRASSSLKWAGRLGLWLESILGAVSLVTVLVALPELVGEPSGGRPSAAGGVFFALCGLVALAIAIYLSFRYTRLSGTLLTSDAEDRPSRARIINLLRFGLVVNLVGMLLTVLGTQAIVGIVLFKSLTQPQLVIGADPNDFVNSIDLLIIQANVNAIAAHFAGIAISLWLLERISR